MTVSVFISEGGQNEKVFYGAVSDSGFCNGEQRPIANAFEIPSFVKDIEIYDVTENQVFLEIYGQVYVYDYLTEANNAIEERY